MRLVLPLRHPLRARDGGPQGNDLYGLHRQADLSIQLPSAWCLRPERGLDGKHSGSDPTLMKVGFLRVPSLPPWEVAAGDTRVVIGKVVLVA